MGIFEGRGIFSDVKSVEQILNHNCDSVQVNVQSDFVQDNRQYNIKHAKFQKIYMCRCL
jgi:hypothetical protein